MFGLKLSGAALLLTTVLVTNVNATTIKNGTHKHIHHTHNTCVNININCTSSHKNHITQKSEVKGFTFSFGRLYGDAKNFVGLSERSNRRQIKNITNVDPVRTPWCAAFVNGILQRNGKAISNSNRAASFLSYGSRVSIAQAGDIVVLGRRGKVSHVGFFSRYETIKGRKYVIVLGGNQSNRVQESRYPVSRIISIRRPS